MSRRPVALAAAALAVLAVSACGTGQQAMTYKEQGSREGASSDLGGYQGISVRLLHVQPSAVGRELPAGGDAMVTGGLGNNGSTPDALIGASSEVAASATLVQGGQDVTSIPVGPLQSVASDWGIRLSGLKKTLLPATYVEVTLEFERAGRVTLQVPVRVGDNGLGERSPAQDPYGGHEAGKETGEEHGEG